MEYLLDLKDVELNDELDGIDNDYDGLYHEYADEGQYDYYDYQYERYETQLDDIVSTSDLQTSIQEDVISDTVQDKRYINNASAVSSDSITLTTSSSDIQVTSTESNDNVTSRVNTTKQKKEKKIKKLKKKHETIEDDNSNVLNEPLQLKTQVPPSSSGFSVFTTLSNVVSGTIQKLGAVNTFVTSPITQLFVSKDKVKEKLLKESYDTLIKYTLLHSVTILLREGIIVMDSFQCNFDSGSIIKARLIEIIILFGNKTNGILEYISTVSSTDKDKNYDIKPKFITAFVSILATYLRYFIKFTRDDCLYYTLVCGIDVKQKFASFMKHTMNIINDISIDIGYDKYFLSINKTQVTEDGKIMYFQPHEPFNIVCDIKSSVDEVRKDSKRYLMEKMAANNWSPSELVNYARELEEASILITDLTNRALSLTSDFCGFNICSNFHNLALKHFWSQNIGENILLGPVDFVTHVKNFIITNNLLSVEDTEDMCETLLTNLRKSIVDESNDVIDMLQLGRVLRGLNNDEEDFVIVIGHIIDLLSNEKKLILPGYNGELMESIVWENNDEMESFHLFNSHQAGWYNIVGPALSGKTFRMMYTCHTYINWETKNIIWLDFKNVNSPQMMIAQLVYQLGLTCVDNSNLPNIFSELNLLISSLRPGSLFIIDHIDSNPYFTSCGDRHDNLFNILFKKLVDASDKLCYVILSRKAVLSSVISFRSRIYVNPFSRPTAMKYIRNFTNNSISTVISSSLLPFVHGNSISVASRGLPGLIFTIIKSFSVRSVMTLALNTSKMPNEKSSTKDKKKKGSQHDNVVKNTTSNEPIIINGWLMSPKGVEEDYNIASEMLFREFSNDEALIVASIYWLRVNEENNILLGTDCSVFTPGLVWHLCKSSFNDDILRWYISWLDLLEVGWIVSNGIMSAAGNEMGYSLSELAKKLRLTSLYSINTGTRGITLFSQNFLYLQYFVNYFLKVNYLVQKESLLLYASYNQYYQHIKNIFIIFMNYTKLHTSAVPINDSPSTLALPKGKLNNISQQDSVMHKLAKLVSGKLSYFLFKYNLIPAMNPGKDINKDTNVMHENILITQAVASCISVDDGFCYIRAQIDVAKQYRHFGMSDEAIKVINDCLKSMNFQSLDENAVSNNQYLAHALTVLLLASIDVKKPKKECDRLIMACKTQWDKLFSVRDNDQDYREFIRATTDIQDKTQTKKGLFSLFKSKNHNK